MRKALLDKRLYENNIKVNLFSGGKQGALSVSWNSFWTSENSDHSDKEAPEVVDIDDADSNNQSNPQLDQMSASD